MKRAVVLAVLALGLAGPAVAHAHSPRYLVSLGDSLAVGGQPGVGETNDGYVDRLLGLLRVVDRRWTVVKFGCSGESTYSMLYGSVLPPAASCGAPDFYRARYPQGTQLASAAAFIRAHRDQVGAVTINVGSNDIAGCFGSIDPNCFTALYAAMQTRLAEILRQLRLAGAREIIGMNYYNPFLGGWTSGPDGPAFARASNDITLTFNAVLEHAYRAAGVPVADVAGAFHISDFNTHGGALPLNVALACRWTWYCSGPPGPDIHPNPTGYTVIALAFAAEFIRAR